MRDRKDVVAGLRAMADWLELHPGANLPFVQVYHYVADAPTLVELADDLGGRWDKQVEENDFALVRDFGGEVRYKLYTSREEVCTRTVIGQKPVVKKVPVDPKREAELREQLCELAQHEETVYEDIVEWECPPSLKAMLAQEDPELA